MHPQVEADIARYKAFSARPEVAQAAAQYADYIGSLLTAVGKPWDPVIRECVVQAHIAGLYSGPNYHEKKID